MKYKILVFGILSLMVLQSCKKDKETSSPTEENNNNNSTTSTYSFTSIANYPGSAGGSTVQFSLNGYGYVGLGDRGMTFYKTFYRYNPGTNTWTSLSDFPAPARRNAISFVLNDTAYVGLGYGQNGSYGNFDDFWKYNVGSDTWTQLNDFPFSTEAGEAFVINSIAYVYDRGSIYKYNKTNDSWALYKSSSDFPDYAGYRLAPANFTIGNKFYVGLGYDDGDLKRLSDFYEYDPAGNTWTKKADFPLALSTPASFNLGNYGFAGTGYASSGRVEDMYKYDPVANTWTMVNAKYPGGTINDVISVVIGDTAYMGLGWAGNYKNNFYKFKED